MTRHNQLFRAISCGCLALALHATAAFTEAPQLHRLVEAGKLPPLGQRLPLAPQIVTPVEKPGVYGGSWRMVLIGYDNNTLLSRSLGYEPLVRWDRNWTRVVPNVASSWTINSDSTVYRFQLRRDMRWSDGVPFTARDIVAWVDDIVRDRELTPAPPAWLVAGGQYPECIAPDDYTVEFRFTAPNAIFLELLACMPANPLTHYPAHYFRQFHLRHNPEGAAALRRKTGLTWAAAFAALYSPWNWGNAAAPTINPWMITAPYAPGAPSVVAVRNPYYWKVDTLGRQLPYLDQVDFAIVADEEEALRLALAGQVDYQRTDFDSVNATAHLALATAEAAGVIRTVRVIPSRANPLALSLNLTHPDPQMRAILSDKRVRIALSLAINRPALIQQLYAGTAVPWQVAPRPASPFFNRRLGEQYTTFLPESAKQQLEELGLHARAADGLRLLPDGRLFKLTILVPAPSSPAWSTILDQIESDWLAVGVTMEWAMLPKDEFYRRVSANSHDGAVLKAVGGYTAILEPDFYVPVSFDNPPFYAIPWARWFINPQSTGAEKPPESVEQQMNLFRRVIAEPNREARTALMARVLDRAADEFYVMGICQEPDRMAIRSPRFRNVPSSHFDSWLYPDPGPFNPCQFFQEIPTAGTAP